MTTFDYKKLTMKEMLDWIEQNEKDEKVIIDFLEVATDENGKMKTVQSKPFFYKTYKENESITWVNPPQKLVNSKETEEVRDRLKALREKYVK